MNKTLFKYFFLAILGVLMIYGFTPIKEEGGPMKVITQDGYSIEVYDFKNLEPLLNTSNDTTYVINFWATWCKPCVKELPAFQKMAAERKQQKVKLILVSLDFPSVYNTQLVPFLKKKNILSKVVVLDDADANSWIPKVNKDWSGAIPATLIFNQTERYFHEGGMTYEELNNQLNKIYKNHSN